MRLIRKPYRRPFPFTHADLRPPIVGRRHCLPAVPHIVFDGRQFTDTEAIDCRRIGQLLRHGRCCFVVVGCVWRSKKKEIILAVQP